MTKMGTKGARFGLAWLGAGMLLAAMPAAAQTGNPALDSPADQLSRNLRSLAENPKSLHALMGAGTAALKLGDAQAAITFFARAEAQAPRDGRVKMWIGAALVQLQQPKSAMRFFKEAVSLGVSDADVAGERGLAHDISGDPAAAQRDYRLALQRGADPEITRRLALSLGISGQREPALQLLEEQLLRRDPAAERSRALILAMTGDSAGAGRAVQARMPGPQATAMTGFLARLPLLNPAERALAVHLGVFPGDARTPAAQTYAAFQPNLDAGAPDTTKPSLARRSPPPEPVSTEPRRRPGTDTAARDTRGRSGTETAARDTGSNRSAPESALSWSRGTLTPSRSRSRDAGKPAATPTEPTRAPVQSAAAAPAQAATDARPPAAPEPVQTAAAVPTWTPPPVEPRPEPQQVSVQPEPPTVLAGVSSLPQGSAGPAGTSPPPARVEIEPAARTTPIDAEATLAALSETVAALAAETPKVEEKPWLKPSAAAPPKVEERKPWLKPAAATPKPAPEKLAAAEKKAEPEKKPAAEKKAAEKKPPAKKAEPAEPARHWVQVAGGANKAALPREFARLKAKAAKLLASRTAWTTPLNATNRLLVGPFKSSGEAQDFVNELAKAELSAFAWTSEAGQKIEKLPAK